MLLRQREKSIIHLLDGRRRSYETTYYRIACDQCGHKGVATTNPKNARALADQFAWHMVGVRDFCPKCYRAYLQERKPLDQALGDLQCQT